MDEEDLNSLISQLIDKKKPENNYNLIPFKLFDAVSDNVTLLQQVVDGSADIDTQGVGADGSTALHVTAKNGNQHLVEHLLNNGATIDVKDCLGNTPLMFSVSKNFIKVAELLLEKGSNINEQNNGGMSPLHIAVSHSYIELTINLIKHGAYIDSRTANGSTPLHIAVKNSLRHVGNTFGSSSTVNFELCKLLICGGADLNIADIYGNTVLHLAVKFQNVILTELLLNRDVAVDLCNDQGSTPLHLSFNSKTPNLCNRLLNKGANVNLSDGNGNTPLHLLFIGNISPCYFEILLRTFLDMGANINKKNGEGNTVLMQAIKYKLAQDLIMVLINRSAEINVQNNEGNTPLMLAFMYLPTHYASVNYTLIRNMVPEKLILGGANVNVQNNEGNTPLHIACTYRYSVEVNLLLNAGCYENIQNANGDTPLHIAMSRVDSSFLDTVLARTNNLGLNIQNKKGDTPLHNALMAATEGYIRYTKTVQKLIDNGARVDIENNDNITPFHITKPNSTLEKIVVEHITKMRVAGLPVGVSPEISDEHMAIKCLEEMEKIKATKINEKHSLTILFSSRINPRYLVTSEKFLENFMATPVIEKMFPQYASLMRIQFKLARERLHLLNLSHYSLEGTRKIKYLQELPFVTKQIIFDYLENEDLKSLSECMRDSEITYF